MLKRMMGASKALQARLDLEGHPISFPPLLWLRPRSLSEEYTLPKVSDLMLLTHISELSELVCMTGNIRSGAGL